MDVCGSKTEHTNSSIVNLAEESEGSLSSAPDCLEDQGRQNIMKEKKGIKAAKNMIDREEKKEKKSAKDENKCKKLDHSSLHRSDSKKEQIKEGSRSGTVVASGAQDLKRSSKAASFFLSKVRI